jgi:hypothetical protein
MKTKRSTECAVLMGLGACHGCASGSKLAFHEDFAHKFIAYGFFAEDRPAVGGNSKQGNLLESHFPIVSELTDNPGTMHLMDTRSICQGTSDLVIAFVGTNPTDQLITAGLPVIQAQSPRRQGKPRICGSLHRVWCN